MTTDNDNGFDDIVGSCAEEIDKIVDVAKQNAQKEINMTATSDKVSVPVSAPVKSAVSMPKPASGGGGKYFKMQKEKHALRLHSFLHEGQVNGCIPVTKHWGGSKFEECTGANCEWCKRAQSDKGITKSIKYRVNVVDRSVKPNRVQIWEMPASAYKDIYKYFNNNGEVKTFGNSGRTFLLEYFKQDKKYSMTPFEKDSAVTEIKPEEIYDLLDGDSRDMPDDGEAKSDDINI